MVNLLGTKLDGAGNLRSVDSRALLSLVKRRGLDLLDPSESRSLANELDASHYVTGDILEAGGRIQIEAALYPSAGEGEPLVRASAEGDTAHLFDLVDSVAAKLLVGMSGGPSARVTRIAGVTTSSLDALRAYLEVESAFRAGSFGKAVEAYQRAVEQDPDFALAYYRLSLAAEWGFLTELSETAAREANERSGRLAERERRLVEALLAWREGEYADAERMYRSLVGSYPDDVEARFQLGEVRFHTGPLVGRSIVEAREDFEGVLSYEPEDTAALVHLARIDAMEGRVDSLASTNQRFQTLNPEGERALEVEALLAFSLGNADEEDRFSRKIAKEGDPGLSVVVWSVGAYTENFDGLGKLGRVMASASRSEDSRLLGHAWLAHLELGGGRRAKALEEIRSMDAFAPGPALENLALLASVPVLPVSREELRVVLRDLSGLDPSAIRRSDATSFLFNAHNSLHAVLVSYLRGLASARLGDGEAASRFADELQTLAVPSFVASLPADLARGVRATLLREQGKLPEALAELREIRNEGFYHWTLASPFCSLAYERFLRAEILLELGEIDQAYSWYESLAGTSPFELLYRGMTHYRRGQIDERRGRKEEARRHYQRFLKLWKDADPEGRPLVDDARARLGRL
jgi:tetratricopeptide (TPR) repeat protein